MKKTASGYELKQLGLDLVSEKAGDYTDYIIEKLRAFCKVRKDLGTPTFRLEEFRQVAVESNWRMPHTPKYWGSLPRIACARKLIKDTEKMERAKSPATRSHKVAVWIAL